MVVQLPERTQNFVKSAVCMEPNPTDAVAISASVQKQSLVRHQSCQAGGWRPGYFTSPLLHQLNEVS